MDLLNEMKKEIQGEVIKKEDLKGKTALIVVDMVEGFTNIGAFASDRVVKIIPNIVDINEKLKDSDKLFFVDEHEENSEEFKAYPVHCIKGTKESEIVNELKGYAKDSRIIKKNSTNGFFAKDFKKWFEEKNDIKNYVITGCITDVCVMQFALSLRSYLNENNLDRNVIIPANCVDTFEGGTHNAELINTVSLFNMKSNGIKIVDQII